MSPTIWDSIADTPWWIYPLYLYFLRIGFLAIKPRLIPLKSIRIFTLVFITGTVLLLILSKHMTTSQFALWCASVMAGTLVGWLQFRLMRVKTEPLESLIRLPGNWLFMCCVIAAMITQYYKGYGYFFSLYQSIGSTLILHWLPVVYGVLGGMLLGKLVYSQRSMKYGPHLSAKTSALM